MGGSMYGADEDLRPAARRQAAALAADAFGQFAATMTTSGIRAGELEGPRPFHSGELVSVRFVCAEGASAGASAGQRLATLKAGQVVGSPAKILDALGATMREFALHGALDEDPVVLGRAIDSAVGTAATWVVDGHLVRAWELQAGSHCGLACLAARRVYMWVGADSAPPAAIQTADLATALQAMSPSKMLG